MALPQLGQARRSSISGLILVFCSCLAGLYVAGQLWHTTHQLYYLEQELAIFQEDRHRLDSMAHHSLPRASTLHGSAPLHCAKILEVPIVKQSWEDRLFDHTKLGGNGTQSLFYSIRPDAGVSRPLAGLGLSDSPPTVTLSDDRLLGQLDWVEAGFISGWACVRGNPSKRLKLLVYVDGVAVGEASTGQPTPHLFINHLCEGQTSESDASASQALGFRLLLPPLQQGRHQVQAFLASLDGKAKQEVNQSPLAFEESHLQANMEQALARKDAIIRVRNAQVATLWDEMHTRQPWRAANGGGALEAFPGQARSNSSRLLMVIAVNTGLTARKRRDQLRRTWVPQGPALRQLELDQGIVIRFIIGRTEQTDDPTERAVLAEAAEFQDILRLDSVDTYADLSAKTLKLFGKLPNKFDADFYFKVDDDVIINVAALAKYLVPRRQQGNLYLGCMKSGPVLTEQRFKWFEPDSWRFGDAHGGGTANYMRHASGQFYGLSAPLTRYIQRSAAVLHKFANEDISVGAWLLGLDVEYVNEARMCCSTSEECNTQRTLGQECLGFFEMSCAGICSSETRLVPLYQDCVLNQGSAASAIMRNAIVANQRMGQLLKNGGKKRARQLGAL